MAAKVHVLRPPPKLYLPRPLWGSIESLFSRFLLFLVTLECRVSPNCLRPGLHVLLACLFSASVSPVLALGYALRLQVLTTRPSGSRLAAGAPASCFLVNSSYRCTTAAASATIVGMAYPWVALPCPCPEPLSSPTNRSVEELAPGHPQRPQLAYTLRRFPHDGSGLAKVHP